MFIAHIPAGYVLTKTLLGQRWGTTPLLALGLFFSIAPDLDLIWFYTLGAKQVPHHQYISHWPLAWIALALPCFVLAVLLHRPLWKLCTLIALCNVLLHLLLDSVAAEIYWFRPFSEWSFNLVHIPAVYSWWVWNFVLHWTFALELAICLGAAIVFYKNKRANSIAVW